MKYKFDLHPSLQFEVENNKDLIREVNSYSKYKRSCFCGCDEGVLLFDKDRYGLEFNFILCSQCGTVRIEEAVSDEDMEDFYENHYRKLYFNMSKPTSKLIEDEQRPRGRSIIEILKKQGINIEESDVLEIGAGAGGILDVFEQAGAQTNAIEPTKLYCEYLREHTKHVVYEGMFTDVIVDGLYKKFDIIIISHVLEHVNDPVAFIKRAMKLLAKKGVIYIEVPSLTNIGESNDRFIDFFHIAHPWAFNKHSLLKLCEDINLRPLYADNKIRAVLTRGEVKSDYKASTSMFTILIFQDILSRLRLLGLKRKLLKKAASLLPTSVKKILKKCL